MRQVFLALALGAALSSAALADAPKIAAELTDADMLKLRQWIAGSNLHMTDDSGVSVPLVSGADVLGFLLQHAPKPAPSPESGK